MFWIAAKWVFATYISIFLIFYCLAVVYLLGLF
jgi:hypothetical protein